MPELSCDYFVIGGGATGMAFVDTLLNHSSTKTSVVMVDKHLKPGGQWNDSYPFVQLHQPSSMYGVETIKLEEDSKHRAMRMEILDYYEAVQQKWKENHEFSFLGGVTFDLSQISENKKVYEIQNQAGEVFQVKIRKKVVDARYLEPDLPVFVQPKFAFNSDSIHCIPPNELSSETERKHFVVIGGGKTGSDAVTHLLTAGNVSPDHIIWVVPNDAWITAREDIGSCMEFLNTCTKIAKSTHSGNLTEYIGSTDFIQNGFFQWEKEGKIHRIDPSQTPTKFNDATLDKEDLELLRKVKQVLRHGRVQSITDDGTLCFQNGTKCSVPFSVAETSYIHCSAGAFNYTKQIGVEPKPLFDGHCITIQDVYGTPGFCFVGSIIGKIESLDMSDAEKNALCLTPQPDMGQALSPLGPSGGDIGAISADHGLVQRLVNLRNWLGEARLRDWLVGHRLFNLGHLSASEISGLVEETYEVLKESAIIHG